jgi:2,3-bisphosphoglycerate-independent phosphoglycerate mutase
VTLTDIIFADSGQQLRQDDPSALKDIINIVQGKIVSRKDAVRYYSDQLLSLILKLFISKLTDNIYDRDPHKPQEQQTEKEFYSKPRGCCRRKDEKIPL